MSANLGRNGSSATRNYRVNSPALEALRRNLQGAIPHGTGKDIARRLGREVPWVYDQIEGKHPLGGDVILGCLHAMPDAARQEALAEFLDGMVRLDFRAEMTSRLQRLEELARETRSLLDLDGAA